MKRAIRKTVTVALFPFLAVLICTMGSLIVLLVLFTNQAKVHARSVVAQQRAARQAGQQEDKQQREQFEDAQWRRELLEQQRAEKTQELAESRAKLSHLEEHIQRLQARARELVERARQIDEGKKLDDGELSASQAEVLRLKDEIARKQSELDEARRQQQSREQSYALIPYDGPGGTRRRPIYIECTSRGIVIQPEGLVFRPDDFNGPMGPGNPLDAALRTIREHLQAAGGQAGDPYPLLVVRPSGIVAYGAARAALKAWDDEFGYELISDQKRLDYGEPDPALAATLQRCVATARQRQAALVAAMPRKFGGEEPLTSFDPATVPGAAPQAFAGGGLGRGVGSGGGGFGVGGTLGGTGPDLGAPGGSGFDSGAGTDGAGTGAGGAGSEAAYPTTSQPGGGLAGSAGGAAGRPSAGGSTGDAAAASGGGAPPLSASGNAVRLGDVPGGGQTGQSAGNSQATGASGGSAGQAGGSGVASGKSRGSNWALPAAANRTTGITRPIRVAVLWDRVVLVPDRGEDRPTKQLRISTRLQQQEVDAFVTAVQQEMRGWGLAVAGGYWKPVLQVEVAPDAEHHLADLQTALQGSGFVIERKAP